MPAARVVRRLDLQLHLARLCTHHLGRVGHPHGAPVDLPPCGHIDPEHQAVDLVVPVRLDGFVGDEADVRPAAAAG